MPRPRGWAVGTPTSLGGWLVCGRWVFGGESGTARHQGADRTPRGAPHQPSTSRTFGQVPSMWRGAERVAGSPGRATLDAPTNTTHLHPIRQASTHPRPVHKPQPTQTPAPNPHSPVRRHLSPNRRMRWSVEEEVPPLADVQRAREPSSRHPTPTDRVPADGELPVSGWSRPRRGSPRQHARRGRSARPPPGRPRGRSLRLRRPRLPGRGT